MYAILRFHDGMKRFVSGRLFLFMDPSSEQGVDASESALWYRPQP